MNFLNVVNDYLGTPREMFDEGGHLKWAAAYTLWGKLRISHVPLEPTNDNGHAIYTRGRAQSNLAVEHAPDQCPIGKTPALVVREMKKSTYLDLEKKGLVKTRNVRGYYDFPQETLFIPLHFRS